jgi:hypothetical protein
MLDKFISERLSNKMIEVYFETGKADRPKARSWKVPMGF